jgi:hypothetical protein
MRITGIRRCIACGSPFDSSNKETTLCRYCESALERMNGYVVPVVHGKWIKDDESIYCSACGFETSSLLPYICDGEKWVPCYANKYCGNCGAKIDLK